MLSDWRPIMPRYTAAQVGKGDRLIALWLAGDGKYDDVTGTFLVNTPQGEAAARPGDWILLLKTGSFCVLRDDDFRRRYEPA